MRIFPPDLLVSKDTPIGRRNLGSRREILAVDKISFFRDLFHTQARHGRMDSQTFNYASLKVWERLRFRVPDRARDPVLLSRLGNLCDEFIIDNWRGNEV